MREVLVLGGVAASAVLLLAWLWLCFVRPGVATVLIVASAVMSSHVFALLYAGGLDAGVVRGLIPVKDAAAVTLAAVLLIRGRHRDPLLLPIALVALASIPALVMGLAREPTSDVLLSGRNALLPFVAAVIALLLEGRQRRVAAVGSVVVIAVAAGYSLIEYLLPLSYLTDVIRLGDYWKDVKEQPFFVSKLGTDLPGNFVTSSGSRRLSGSFGDPLAAGYALAGATLLATHLSKSRLRVFAVLLLLLALFLTFTRAGLLFVILVFTPIVIFRGGHMSRRGWSVSGFVAAVAVALAFVATPFGSYFRSVVTGNDGSTNAHIGALRGLGNHPYSLFGQGFGSAGAATASGTENVFVTLALQVGALGLLLYLVAFGLIAVRGSPGGATNPYAWPTGVVSQRWLSSASLPNSC